MKKISLKNLKLEASDMLQRSQLKTVFGGYGGYAVSSCTADCGDSISVTCSGTYSCTAKDNDGCDGDNGTDKKSCPPIT